MTKRTQIISATASNGTKIEIEVKIDSGESLLLRTEVQKLVDHLTDNAMLSISTAPHSRTPISRVRVKKGTPHD